MSSKGFTLIELVVTLAIIAVLSGVVLFSIAQYVNKGKDSNVAGNLSVLVNAGEAYYDGNNSSYNGFCDVTNSVIKNIVSQIPPNTQGSCYEPTMPTGGNISGNPAGVCCAVSITNQTWAACAKKFTNSSSAFCVDSKGVKKEITAAACTNITTQCPLF